MPRPPRPWTEDQDRLRELNWLGGITMLILAILNRQQARFPHHLAERYNPPLRDRVHSGVDVDAQSSKRRFKRAHRDARPSNSRHGDSGAAEGIVSICAMTRRDERPQ